MAANSSPVQGPLLRWARLQQGRTMRWVQQNGGPSVGLQSEVEHGVRTTVSANTLKKWVIALQVTVAFARGELPRYYENPHACSGLAGDVASLVATPLPNGTDFAALDPMARVREVVRLVVGTSSTLPETVLAHVLGLELNTLNHLLNGQLPVTADLLTALVNITAIPESFFKHGAAVTTHIAALQEYLPAMRIAARFAITPEEVEELVITRARAECPPRWGRSGAG